MTIATMTMSDSVPDEDIAKLDLALTEALGFHGPWVMAMETYQEDGQMQLMVCWSKEGSAWLKVGIAQGLLDDLRIPFRQESD